MAFDKALISGSMSMLLLRLLEEKDMYGYEMIETLRKRSDNVFELKAGTMYPLLHTLEDKGLLTVYERKSQEILQYYKRRRQIFKWQKEGVETVYAGREFRVRGCALWTCMIILSRLRDRCAVKRRGTWWRKN